MLAKKNAIAEAVRQLIELRSGVVETSRADSMLGALSFQSMSHPERHVWLETNLGGMIIADLEDWIASDKWDNAVGHIAVVNIYTLVQVAISWLYGNSFSHCLAIGGEQIGLR